MVARKGSGVKRNFWKMGKLIARLYPDSLDPTERRKLMVGRGSKEPLRDVLGGGGERGDGGTGEGASAGIMGIPSE